MTEFRYWNVHRPLEKLRLVFVWAMPRWLVYWCAIRLIAHATQGPYCHQVVPELTRDGRASTMGEGQPMSDPKLLQARDEIAAILTKHDIAGHVVLHNKPGSFEIFTRLDPSYSKLIGLPPEVRLSSKLADYNGDAEAQRADLQATANMISGLGELCGKTAIDLINLGQWVDAKTGAEHTSIGPDPDSNKNTEN